MPLIGPVWDGSVGSTRNLSMRGLLMAESRNCSNCGRISWPATLICDCGYDFRSGQMLTGESLAPQPPMTPMRLWFGFNGRINRSTYWKGMLVYSLLSLGWILILAFYALVYSFIGQLWFWGGAVLFVWCGYAIAAKRWHDRNKTGWWSLIQFIPLVGAVVAFVQLGCLRGTPGRNDYGPEP